MRKFHEEKKGTFRIRFKEGKIYQLPDMLGQTNPFLIVDHKGIKY